MDTYDFCPYNLDPAIEPYRLSVHAGGYITEKRRVGSSGPSLVEANNSLYSNNDGVDIWLDIFIHIWKYPAISDPTL